MITKNSDILIKASGAIHISHKLTLIQQQLWNYLLKYAFSEILEKEEHTIEVSLLRSYLDTRNEEHIAQALSGLGIKVHYNILGKDNKNKWGFINLLEYAEVENGICTYSYSAKLRQLLHNPTFYTKINLLIQKKFDSKYALFLYELCIDYAGINQTPVMDIDKFRYFMGLGSEEYPEFKAFNSKIIKPAIKEVSEKSDLFVDVKYIKEKNKVVRVKFFIEKKPHATQEDNITKSITPAVLDNEENEIIKQLQQFNINEDDIKNITQTYSEEVIQEKIDLLKANHTPIKNTSAWLITALKQNYKSHGYDKHKEEEKKKIKTKEKVVRLEEDTKKLEVLKREYNAYKNKTVLDRYNKLPEYIRSAIDQNFENWIIQKNKESAYFKYISHEEAKLSFLSDAFVEYYENNFDTWLSNQGYKMKKVGDNYEFI